MYVLSGKLEASHRYKLRCLQYVPPLTIIVPVEIQHSRLRGRTKTGGHPGAPPPNRPRRRKLSKHRQQHAQDESTPQTNAPCENIHRGVRAGVRRKRREPNPAVASGRYTSYAGQGGSGSDDSGHATIRPPCPVHPSSASCVQARFMSSDMSRTEAVAGVGRGTDPADCPAKLNPAEGGVALKESASRRRVEEGCILSKSTNRAQYQVDSGEEPPAPRSRASGNKRRPILLRVSSCWQSVVSVFADGVVWGCQC